MSTCDFVLADPVVNTGHTVRTSFVLTVVSALTLSVGTYEMCLSSSGLMPEDFSPVSSEAIDASMSALLSNEFSQKENMLNRLEGLFAELQHYGWDGYGAAPLQRAAYLNTRSLIEHMTGSQLAFWNLFPSPNGTFLLSVKNGDIASVSIGDCEYSFAAMKDGVELIGREKFDSSRALAIVENIHTLLKYNG